MDVPFVILGNKVDKGASFDTEKVEEEYIEKGKAKAHFVISATESRQVEHAFNTVAQLAFDYSTREEKITVQLAAPV